MKANNKGSIRTIVNLFVVVVMGFAATYQTLPSQAVQAGLLVAHNAPTDVTIHYASPGGFTSGSCDSWVDACELQYALTSAASGTEIWVEEGRYLPGLAVTSTFQLKNGVALYGGFAGAEENRDERDWEDNLTVLSGDINSDDPVDANGIVNVPSLIVPPNTFHVVTGGRLASPVDETAVLDGFVVTAGHANDTLTSAGMNGGGFYNANGNPTINQVTFCGDYARSDGGGAYNESNSYVLAMTNVIFKNSQASDTGGGFYNGANDLILEQVTFSGNQAYYGAGFFLAGNGNVRVTNADFIGNVASSTLYYTYGAGFFVSQGGSGRLTMTNVKFSGNYSTWYGGGATIGSGGVITLTNVTFSGNYAGNQGGGLYNMLPTTKMVNSILWGNAAGSSNPQLVSGGISISYSDIQQASGVFPGTGNINADPLFVAPISASLAPTTAGDYHLQIPSPAIDAGNNAVLTVATDLDGYPRRIDIPSVPDTGFGTPPIVDMGAYEVMGPPVANAGADQIVGNGLVVTLDGSASYDPGGHLPLAYQWTQTGGPSVLLSSTTVVTPTFTAPMVSEATPVSFSLVVTNTVGQPSLADTVVITVELRLCLPVIVKD